MKMNIQAIEQHRCHKCTLIEMNQNLCRLENHARFQNFKVVWKPCLYKYVERKPQRFNKNWSNLNTSSDWNESIFLQFQDFRKKWKCSYANLCLKTQQLSIKSFLSNITEILLSWISKKKSLFQIKPVKNSI